MLQAAGDRRLAAGMEMKRAFDRPGACHRRRSPHDGMIAPGRAFAVGYDQQEIGLRSLRPDLFLQLRVKNDGADQGIFQVALQMLGV